MSDDIKAQVRAVLWPAAREHETEDGQKYWVQFDAYHDLDGALIDLRRTGADPVCIRTIERVQKAIARVAKIVQV